MPPNPLRRDPSRTATLRRQYMAAMSRRFSALRAAITDAVVTQDVFGLAARAPLRLNVEPGQFAFASDDRKLELFMAWLQEQVDAGILTTTRGIEGFPWNAEFVESAYKKAQARAYIEANRGKVLEDEGLLVGGQRGFLLDSFAAAETLTKLKLLYIRNFEQLKGVTAAMSQEMSRVLADGLAHGRHPREIATALNRTVAGITKRRALVIARTEIIHAHAEGQLDAFVRLGVGEVGLAAEWVTAADPCPQCAAQRGRIFTIDEARGMIPLHPNCRCAWIPVIVENKRRR